MGAHWEVASPVRDARRDRERGLWGNKADDVGNEVRGDWDTIAEEDI